ncbi:hypothetical protein [Pseudomonas hunanensis]
MILTLTLTLALGLELELELDLRFFLTVKSLESQPLADLGK